MRKFRQISIKYRKKLWKWNSTVFPFKHAPLNFNDPLCFIIGIIRQNIGCIYISVENRIKLSEPRNELKLIRIGGGGRPPRFPRAERIRIYPWNFIA